VKYESPQKYDQNEINFLLSGNDLSPRARIRLVLSAIYYGDTIEYSGNVLIKEFCEAKYEEKIDLMNLFGTFYQMCATSYRIDDSISLLSQYAIDSSENFEEIMESVAELIEFKEMFSEK